MRELIEIGADWLPWGYRMSLIASGVELHPGDVVELWEADDTRDPHCARPLVAATVDFISRTDGYLALTLRPRHGEACLADPTEVVAAARRRTLLAPLPVAAPLR